MPPARLALRVLVDAQGPGIAAQWLDDANGEAQLTIIARRVTETAWLLPASGISPNQLALGLANVIEAVADRPSRRIYLDLGPGGRQHGLAWETPVTVPYDALDPLAPAPFVVSLLDARWESPQASLERMQQLAERIRGHRWASAPRAAIRSSAEMEGSPSLAQAVTLIATTPESTLDPPDSALLALPS